ncbi:MAG TPA: NUDIX domain-containing protein [Bacillota bacterium]|nr:NUDIX domain-containing protein [Bacillota bacterium]
MRTIVSAGGIILDGDRLLLVKQPAGYGFIKGAIHLGETPEQAAIREVAEESGLYARPLRYIGKIARPSREDSGEPVMKHIELFFMEILGEVDKEPEKRTEWVPYAQAVKLMWHPEEAEFLNEHRPDIVL